MRLLQQTKRNLITYGLMTVMLPLLLLPQADFCFCSNGFCLCLDCCRSEEDSSSPRLPESEPVSGKCDCCGCGDSGFYGGSEAVNRSHISPKDCGETCQCIQMDVSRPPVSQLSADSVLFLENLKFSAGVSLEGFLPQYGFEDSVFPAFFFETLTSRLPVRLHLLQSVLRI
jgi:hypothetical protein